MTEPRAAPAMAARNRVLLGGLFLLVALGLAWSLASWSSGGDAAPEADARERRKARIPHLRPRDPAAAPAASPKRAIAPEELGPENGHPHPITSEHERLYRQTDLLNGAWKSIRDGKYDEGRALVAALRQEYPGEWEDRNEGLEIVAECLEHPSEAIVARARKFHRERTASTMRRRLRKHCIEPWEQAHPDTNSED